MLGKKGKDDNQENTPKRKSSKRPAVTVEENNSSTNEPTPKRRKTAAASPADDSSPGIELRFAKGIPPPLRLLLFVRRRSVPDTPPTTGPVHIVERWSTACFVHERLWLFEEPSDTDTCCFHQQLCTRMGVAMGTTRSCAELESVSTGPQAMPCEFFCQAAIAHFLNLQRSSSNLREAFVKSQVDVFSCTDKLFCFVRRCHCRNVSEPLAGTPTNIRAEIQVFSLPCVVPNEIQMKSELFCQKYDRKKINPTFFENFVRFFFRRCAGQSNRLWTTESPNSSCAQTANI